MLKERLLRRAYASLLVLLAVTFLSACTSQDKLPLEEKLIFKTDTGLEIVGTIYRPADVAPPWPGVLLLHMIYGKRQDWDGFARTLA